MTGLDTGRWHSRNVKDLKSKASCIAGLNDHTAFRKISSRTEHSSGLKGVSISTDFLNAVPKRHYRWMTAVPVPLNIVIVVQLVL